MSKKDGFLKAGQILVLEGEESTECFWLQKGTMRATVRDSGKTRELCLIQSGELIGEMAFFDQKPRSCTVTAVTDCQFLVLHREDFAEMFDSQPMWIKKIIQTLSDRLRQEATIKKAG
jgi:CRP-like cAMP-binding protein